MNLPRIDYQYLIDEFADILRQEKMENKILRERIAVLEGEGRDKKMTSPEVRTDKYENLIREMKEKRIPSHAHSANGSMNGYDTI